MSIIGSNILAGAAGASGAATGYQIERSLRFNSADSAYLNRTPSSAGNRKTWTWSGWVKRTKLSSGNQHIFDTNGPYTGLYFSGSDGLIFRHYTSGTIWQLSTNRQFRDASAWYHIVVNCDTTQATASNRLAMYINGVKETNFATSTYPSPDYQSEWSNSSAHYIGQIAASGYFDGYLADVHFVDGQALAPTDFGEFDDNNVWQPKRFSGTYGTNGFHLDFSDNSSNAALGTDSSGNSNTWTVNNLTAESPLSLPSVDFDGNDRLTVPSFTGAPQGTNDWTIEFYAYFAAWSGNKVVTWAAETSHPNYRIAVQVESGKYFIVDGGNYGSSWYSSKNDVNSYTSVVAPLNRWHHVAVQRASGVDTIYIDGQVQFTASGHTASSPSVTGNWIIGGGQSGSTDLVGKLSNFRVLSGTALYSSTFTPPSTPLTNITNTVLLCCQSSSSATAAAVSPGTLTTTGDPTAATISDSTAANDSLVDTPTNYGDDTGAGGEVRGNYATMNPLDTESLTLSNGNLDITNFGGSRQTHSTIFQSSGKWYAEFTITAALGDVQIGVANNDGTSYLGSDANSWGVISMHGNHIHNASQSSYGSSFTTGDNIMVALDMDNGKWYAGKNGTWFNSGNPANGTNPAYTGLSGNICFAVGSNGTNGAVSCNFGARSFSFAAPSGYKALCTQSLPEPTIADGSAYFGVKTWDGTGSSQAITGYGFSPDFAWIKARNNTASHALLDTVRGNSIVLKSEVTNAETTNTSVWTSFDSDGFTLGADTGAGWTNYNNWTYVGWAWDAGANSSKTYTVTVVSDSGNKYRFDGHGTSAVTLDLEEGSTYTFDQSDSSNAGHPLRFSTTSDGTHGSGSEYTTGVVTNGTPGSSGAYTKITIAASAPTLYYYCSSHSGMGGQINTNSTAGATVLSGSLNDDLYNQSQTWSSDATGGSLGAVTIAFNGQVPSLGSSPSSGNYSAPITFSPSAFSASGSVSSLIIYASKNSGSSGNIKVNNVVIPITANNTFQELIVNVTSFSSIVAEHDGSTGCTIAAIYVNGKLLVDSGVSLAAVPSINSVVRANPAAGFSIVSYTGDGSAASVGHGLNAAPGLYFIKNRSSAVRWTVYHSAIGADGNLFLNENSANAPNSGVNGTTGPDSNVFYLKTSYGEYNANGANYIAYCFSPVSGFSSMGSYLGNGSDNGPFVFTGMRPKWVIIKASSSTSYGNWVIHDTERSTVNVSNKGLYANLSNAEDATYALDFLSNGFKIRSSSYDAHNGNGKTYIYYAVAENPFRTARAR